MTQDRFLLHKFFRIILIKEISFQLINLLTLLTDNFVIETLKKFLQMLLICPFSFKYGLFLFRANY